MKTLVVYYSLSGNTQIAATALAKELRADVEEIHCSRYSAGPWGYLKAAYDSWRGEAPPIDALKSAPLQYDLVVVAGPIWAFHPAPPLRSLLRRDLKDCQRLALLLTHGGSAAAGPLNELQRIAGRAPVAVLAVTERDIKSMSFGATLSAFAQHLGKTGAT